MTNHTTALSFARDTTVYAHAPAKEDVANLKAAYLELRQGGEKDYSELLARLDSGIPTQRSLDTWKVRWFALAAQRNRDVAESAAAIRNLQAAYTAAHSELEAAERLVYVPGVLKCAKCNCVVISTLLDAANGRVAANNDPQQCPNGCGPMWRRTERDAGNELCDRLDKEYERAERAVADLAACREVADGLRAKANNQRRELRRLNKYLGPYWSGFRKGMGMEAECKLRGIMNAAFGHEKVRAAELAAIKEQSHE